MKKFICVLLTLVMAATFCLVNVGAEDNFFWGDVTCDGALLHEDLVRLKQFAYLESYVRSGIYERSADVYRDDVIDAKDVVILNSFFGGLGVLTLPVTPVASEPISGGKISVSSTNYLKGSGQVELTVTAEGLPDITALDLEISSVTKGLFFVRIEDLSGSLQETHGTDDGHFYPIPVPFLSENGMNKNFNGPLCKLIFNISEEVYNVYDGDEFDVNIVASNKHGGTFQVSEDFTKMTLVDYDTQGGTVTVVEPPTDTECALEILEYLVGRLGEIGDSADYNGDGEVDIKDALWLLKRLVGIEV